MMTPKKQTEVRVRFAPSPTGYFHIGSARTTLFAWLFTRHNNGRFILRIEDTDKERSKKEFEEDIFASLKWLGLNCDEGPLPQSGTQTSADVHADQRGQNSENWKGEYGPYRQSERLNLYEKYLKQLLQKNQAYYCFCTKEELENERQSMLASGQAPIYNGKCRALSEEEVRQNISAGKSSVIRFKTPRDKVTFPDLIRGSVTFDNALSGDIVIAKGLREPLYNFSVVIDDYEMKISHVIRGEEHLANTPKQIALQTALGFSSPEYGHIPLILNPDRSKMSKRAGDTALKDYRAAGYLPVAILNFLVLLGWHPTGDNEIFDLDQMIKEFDLDRVQKSGAAFNPQKLDWFNAHYLRKLSDAELILSLQSGGFIPANSKLNESQLVKLAGLVKERLKKLSDFLSLTDFFFELPYYSEKLLIWKEIKSETVINNLEACREGLKKIDEKEFTKAMVESAIIKLSETRGRGEVMWPLRVALSGKDASPGPVEIAEVIGKAETLRRIDAAIQKFAPAQTFFKE